MSKHEDSVFNLAYSSQVLGEHNLSSVRRTKMKCELEDEISLPEYKIKIEREQI